jgi:hypothetical protein
MKEIDIKRIEKAVLEMKSWRPLVKIPNGKG